MDRFLARLDGLSKRRNDDNNDEDTDTSPEPPPKKKEHLVLLHCPSTKRNRDMILCGRKNIPR